MENTQKDANLSGEEALKVNLRVQKTAYIKQRLEKQREAEDARLERLLQEQEVIEGLRQSIDGNMWQTEENRKYNQEFQESINMQIYESNGITGDKLMGMREYKNALYRGCAAALFFLSMTMTVLCGVLHGFHSDVCLLMFAYTAVEGALLSQEKRRPPVLDLLCRILYILTFPAMLIMFVCYELKYGVYGVFLPYAVVLGVFVVVLGTISYFLHNPYSRDKKKWRDANKQIREIERLAEKEVRKKRKNREKEERNAQKHAGRGNQKTVETEPNALPSATEPNALPSAAEPNALPSTTEPLLEAKTADAEE